MFMKSRRWIRSLRTYSSSRQRSPGPSAMLGSKPCLEPLEDRTLLNAGDLDPTFGMGGKVTTTFQGTVGSQLYAIAQEPDGKIITLDNTSGWGLSRHNLDGSLDTSFGSGGTLI